jgi:hypothetical protein
MKRYAVALALALAATGCLHSQGFGQRWHGMDQDSKAAWLRCMNPVMEMQCGTDSRAANEYELMKVASCAPPLQESYLDTPRAHRAKWLARHGCPRDVAGYEPEAPAPATAERPDALPAPVPVAVAPAPAEPATPRRVVGAER